MANQQWSNQQQFYNPNMPNNPNNPNNAQNNFQNNPNAYGGSFYGMPQFDPYGMMTGSMLNMNMMNGSMMNMNQPPPNQSIQPQQHQTANNNNVNNTNNGANNYSYAFNPPQNFMNAPMNPLQQMAQTGSWYGANPNMMQPQQQQQQQQPQQQQPPPPPPNNNVNYNNFNNNIPKKEKKKRKKKKKKKKDPLAKKAGLAYADDSGDYSLSAPKPRKNRKKVAGGRIRNSFLMTSSSQMGSNKASLSAQIGFRSKTHHHKGRRDPSAIYSEKRKKKVSYSRKETEKMKSKLLSSNKNMKKLRDVTDTKQKNKLIMKKIHLCKYVCDFRAASSGIIIDHKEKKRIDNKAELLSELHQYFETSQWHISMGKDLYKFLESLFKMISHNLFRVLPDGDIIEAVKTDNTGKDAKITISKELPSWKHLDLIYKIFLDILNKLKENGDHQNMVIEYLENFNVISNIIYLLNSEEVREEEAVAQITQILYSSYPPVRLFILGQLSNVCYSYLYINNRDYRIGSDKLEKNKLQKEYSKQLASGVKTVLIIFRQCLIGSDEEEIDGWIELLCKVIIPLHKASIDEFVLFDDALAKISVTFCEKYFLSFIYIFQGMLRYWPRTSSKKEQLFLRRIGPLLDTADEDCWEFKNKSECEFRDVFTQISHRIVDSVHNYTHTHYATAEQVVEMLEDDTLQRFIDIYGGKHCWIKLYKGVYDISTKYFWKETIDKCLEFIENCKEEDDIPMQYIEDYEEIDKMRHKQLPPNIHILKQNALKEKRLKRLKYYQYLNKKYQKKNIAQYQKHVYKNNQPMLQLYKKELPKVPPPFNGPKGPPPFSKPLPNTSPFVGHSVGPPPPPITDGLPKPVWDDDDF